MTTPAQVIPAQTETVVRQAAALKAKAIHSRVTILQTGAARPKLVTAQLKVKPEPKTVMAQPKVKPELKTVMAIPRVTLAPKPVKAIPKVTLAPKPVMAMPKVKLAPKTVTVQPKKVPRKMNSLPNRQRWKR